MMVPGATEDARDKDGVEVDDRRDEFALDDVDGRSGAKDQPNKDVNTAVSDGSARVDSNGLSTSPSVGVGRLAMTACKDVT